MTDNYINISEIKATTKYEELRIQFFNEIVKLKLEQWLEICLRFEDDEDNISAAVQKITLLKSKYSKLLFKDHEEKKHWVQFVGWLFEKRISYFLKLPETIDHNGQPYLLRITANQVTNYAESSFILMAENLPVKNKDSLLIPCLRPFYGYVNLPPLDYDKKPSKSKKMAGTQNIKLSDVEPETDLVFHIAFPKKYLTFNEKPPERLKIPPLHFNEKRTEHATWNFDRFIDLECSFGGEGNDKCAVCGGALSHLITLPAIKGMPYTDLKQLTLSTCMKCVGWVGEPIFFKHDNEGKPMPCPIKEGSEEGEGDEGVIKPAIVFLSRTPPKFYKQSWGKSDDQNLNRIGGSPSWVQGKHNFKCPVCKKPMSFLMQLDSGLPTVDGQRWLWGSGGVLFIFWCDDCKIDGQMWQCT